MTFALHLLVFFREVQRSNLIYVHGGRAWGDEARHGSGLDTSSLSWLIVEQYYFPTWYALYIIV